MEAKKKTEKTRTASARYGMDFGLSADCKNVSQCIRFIRKNKLSRKNAREQLAKAGCFSIEHLQDKLNLDWL